MPRSGIELLYSCFPHSLLIYSTQQSGWISLYKSKCSLWYLKIWNMLYVVWSTPLERCDGNWVIFSTRLTYNPPNSRKTAGCIRELWWLYLLNDYHHNHMKVAPQTDLDILVSHSAVMLVKKSPDSLSSLHIYSYAWYVVFAFCCTTDRQRSVYQCYLPLFAYSFCITWGPLSWASATGRTTWPVQ